MLEALVAKDQYNYSRPPSTDPPRVKRTKSLRRPLGKSVPMGRQGITA